MADNTNPRTASHLDGAPTEHIAFLERHGTATHGHSDHDLLSHLRGVRQLLARWGARPALVTAGLFHSVYGTESYATATLPLHLRPEVRALVGDEAERLAYLFGAMTKQSLYPNLAMTGAAGSIVDRFTGEELTVGRSDLSDLFELVSANWLEQRMRVGVEHRFHRKDEFKLMLPWLSPDARAAVSVAYGFASA